ncbi:MAG: flagellar biosynthesis protein [Burkholderiales bacterium]|nr:flagellar biosynthesis protein [Burkholderiales bacterium]
MRDFYASTSGMPLDQADGLRRLFAGRRRHLLPLAANPHVPFSGLVLDRLASAYAAQGRSVLVVDAASTSPAAHELSGVDLAACIEQLAPRVAYLPARGLPLSYVDTRGSAGGFIDAVQHAAPQAEVVLLHADGVDLARLLKQRSARPLLLGADHPESIKHAYANAKLLARRCDLMTYDLLLTAAPHSPRAAGIVASLAGCLENFLDATLLGAALIDPALDPLAEPDEALAQLMAGQLALESGVPRLQPRPAPAHPTPVAAAAGATFRPAFR